MSVFLSSELLGGGITKPLVQMRKLSPRDLKLSSRSCSLRQEVAEAESELRSASWKATTP